MSDMKALRELLAKATPLPWKSWIQPVLSVRREKPFRRVTGLSLRMEDSALLLAAVNALPALLASAEMGEAGRIDYGLMERANQIVGEWAGQGEERTIVQLVHDAMVAASAAARERALGEAVQVLNQMGDDDMADDREIARWGRAIDAIRALSRRES